MGPSYGALLVVYALATWVGIALVVVSWHHRDKSGAVPLAAVAVAATLSSGARLLGTAVDAYVFSVLMERLLYPSVALGVMAVVLLALEYTRREYLITRRTVAVLSIEPLAVLVLAVANPRNLFFESISRDPTMPTGVAVEWGVAFDLHIVYTYVLLVLTAVMILEYLFTSRAVYRGQAAALFGATLLPLLANAVHVVGPVEYDTTPVGYVLMGVLYAVAIVRYQFIGLVPMARDRVLDHVSDGVFVLDADDRLLDVNPVGRRMLAAIGVETDAIVGKSFPALLPTESLREQYDIETAQWDESETVVSVHDHHFQVVVTPIEDPQLHRTGWLLIAREVTERKRRENRLERQNERLERFATLVSHDLRNPLTVARGYIDVARDTGDLTHLEDVERAHDRMETIIEDVLTLAQEGAGDADPVPVEVAALANRAWRSVETERAALSIESDASVLADPERTRRLLENLFRNAVEHGTDDYTSREERQGRASDDVTLSVRVGIERDDGPGLTVYVEDDGPGIPTEERGRIFEDGYTTSDDGTGLGLSIVKQIAEAHGWTVSVVEGTDGGARFHLGGVEPATDRQERDSGASDGVPSADSNETADAGVETTETEVPEDGIPDSIGDRNR